MYPLFNILEEIDVSSLGEWDVFGRFDKFVGGFRCCFNGQRGGGRLDLIVLTFPGTISQQLCSRLLLLWKKVITSWSNRIKQKLYFHFLCLYAKNKGQSAQGLDINTVQQLCSHFLSLWTISLKGVCMSGRYSIMLCSNSYSHVQQLLLSFLALLCEQLVQRIHVCTRVRHPITLCSNSILIFLFL